MTISADSLTVRWAEVVLPCDDLAPTLAFFTDQLGFRIELIFPAEEPHTAVVSGRGLRLRLAPGGGDPGALRIGCAAGALHSPETIVAPNGTRIDFVQADASAAIPPLKPSFVVTSRADGPGEGVGRAGMIYRDLIPDRQGGRYIASHIALPEGGLVADWVHYHRIRFQLIFCRKGWARLVYEDQGPPFLFEAGDCVLQPPEIRHRVLESSPGFEVVEVGCPALHETFADHAMVLPNGRLDPARDFGGQRFAHSRAAETPWLPIPGAGFERRETGLARASAGVVDTSLLRPAGGDSWRPGPHTGELLFGFVLNGSAMLHAQGDHSLRASDAFAIPAGEPWSLAACSPDFELLEVSAPSNYAPD